MGNSWSISTFGAFALARCGKPAAVFEYRKDELVDFIVHRAFYPVLMAFRAGPSRAMIKHLQDVAREEIDRLRRCTSVEDVIISFKRDLGTKPDSVTRSQLQQLHLPVIDDVRDDFERKVRELGFEPDSVLFPSVSPPSIGASFMDQDRISQRAYAIWQGIGEPDGAHEEHWQQACREIEAEDAVPASDPVTIVEGTPDVDRMPSKTEH